MSIKSIIKSCFPDQMDFKYNLAAQAIEEYYRNLRSEKLEPGQLKLFGTDKASSYSEIINQSNLESKASDIYTNEEYNECIKFIWVLYPDNTEKRLVDLVPM